MKNSKEYKFAKYKAMQHQGANESTDKAFEAGYDFAMSQPKHIFDGVAVVGEVRRFEGGLVDVVANVGHIPCTNCVFQYFSFGIDCQFLIGCDTHNVKYIKR